MRRTKPLETHTELKRHTPLPHGGKPLKRTRLRAVSEKRAAQPKKRPRVEPAVDPKTLRIIVTRSGGWCEMRLTGCLGRATDTAHRCGRKAGGRKGATKASSSRPSNALRACRACHAWSHARPAESYELGLMLKEGQDPLVEPVVYRGVLSFLTDGVEVVPFEERETAA